MLAAFPLFVGVAAIMKRGAFVPALGASAGLLPLLLVYYTFTFVNTVPGTVVP